MTFVKTRKMEADIEKGGKFPKSFLILKEQSQTGMLKDTIGLIINYAKNIYLKNTEGVCNRDQHSSCPRTYSFFTKNLPRMTTNIRSCKILTKQIWRKTHTGQQIGRCQSTRPRKRTTGFESILNTISLISFASKAICMD